MQSFSMKKVPPYFVAGRGDTMLYPQIFSHFWKYIPNVCGTSYDLSSKNYLATVFKVIQYGFEISQTVLSLNWKVI